MRLCGPTNRVTTLRLETKGNITSKEAVKRNEGESGLVAVTRINRGKATDSEATMRPKCEGNPGQKGWVMVVTGIWGEPGIAKFSMRSRARATGKMGGKKGGS